jgi:FkbM family methyltransferase
MNTLSQSAKQLKEVLGGATLVVADVGAANGVLPHFRAVQEVATFYLFEPEGAAYRRLVEEYARDSRTNVHVVNTALASRQGERTLHVANQATGSSLLRPRTNATDYTISSYFFPLREVQIHTNRLADVLDTAGETALHMIKIDVQGAELEVLEGLDDARASTLISAQVEVGMPGSYENQPSLADVERWMGKHGLALFDLEPARATLMLDGDSNAYHTRVFNTFRRSPSVRARLWEVEAFYFRKEELVLESGDADTVRRLMAAYAVHGFFAHAHSLAGKAHVAGILEKRAARALEESLVSWHAASLGTSIPERAKRTFKRMLHKALTPERATRIYARIRS